jgi:hypothetical protein
MVMGKGFVSMGNWEVVDLINNAQSKIVEGCNFWSVIKIFCLKLVGEDWEWGNVLRLFIRYALLTQTCKKTSTCLCT